jgi:hypothetical protein
MNLACQRTRPLRAITVTMATKPVNQKEEDSKMSVIPFARHCREHRGSYYEKRPHQKK